MQSDRSKRGKVTPAKEFRFSPKDSVINSGRKKKPFLSIDEQLHHSGVMYILLLYLYLLTCLLSMHLNWPPGNPRPLREFA